MAAQAAAKKRRPEEEEAEVEEEMHLAFRGAANALSQVYGQAVAAQEKSFLAGERRAMESVYRWVCSKHQEGLEVSVADLVAFLQTEIEHRAGEVPGSLQRTNAQPACHFPSANVQGSSFCFGNVADALNSHTAQTGQTQTTAYGLINSPPDGIGAQNNHSPQNQNFMHCNSYEPSMDES